MPFMGETMLRSGVPPHMGQSPLPGSDANEQPQRANRANAGDQNVRFIGLVSPSGYRNRRRTGRRRTGRDCPACWESGSMRSISHASGSGSRGGPGLAANARLAVGRVLDAQLEVIPGVRLPGERRGGGARHLRLPGIHLQPLIVAEGDQRVALRDDAGVAHLAPLFGDADVGLDRVVRPVRRSHEDADALEQRLVGKLLEHLLAVEFAHLDLARRRR